jgi:7-cyano-7-deazaguanine synthase in queuosine biosynthesis
VTSFVVRVSPSDPLPTDPEVVPLNWFVDQRAASTIQTDPRFLHELTPRSVAGDFLRLAGAAYCTDKLALRRLGPDRWTREIHLDLPVSDQARWQTAATTLSEALDFLTGDHWNLSFRESTLLEDSSPSASPGNVDAVCLFSGGLDSLCGAIDLLEDGHRLCLVGHYEGGLIPGVQETLAAELAGHYGAEQVALRQLFLRPAAARAGQARPLPRRRERSTRARSLLFIAAGMAVADALGPTIPLYVPENGFIGINVPLSRARSGSLSTRTTHPYFLRCLGAALTALAIDNPLRNLYRLQTKGAMLNGSRNRRLLERLAPRSVSCAHPEAARWLRRQQGNCGYCYPCLIRRAALHTAGWDHGEAYAWDALQDTKVLEGNRRIGADLRAILWATARKRPALDVLRNGPVPDGEVQAFAEVVRRGQAELLAWLTTGSSVALRARLPSSS